MRLLVCVLVLFSNFGFSEGGSSYKRRILKEKKENREMVIEQIAKKGPDNVPYWYILCQNDLKECLKPIPGVRRHTSHKVFTTKKCDHQIWEWSDCQEMCFRNNLTPGNVWENCTPYSTNPILSVIFLTVVICLVSVPFIIVSKM